MSCERLQFDGAVGHVCARGRRAAPEPRCGCGALATALCDGRVAGTSGRTRRCDAPVCDGHATPAPELGEGLHRCPACVESDRLARAVLLPRREGALVAYTDGSGTVADRPCGIGVVLCWRAEVILEASVGYSRGTNNAAELLAIRHALWAAGVGGMSRRPLEVRSDSLYAINALQAAEDPHPRACNAALIVAIRRRIAQRPGPVAFEHVRGHAGELGNERADWLAGRARRIQMGERHAP